jgi:hypothetical protein
MSILEDQSVPDFAFKVCNVVSFCMYVNSFTNVEREPEPRCCQQVCMAFLNISRLAYINFFSYTGTARVICPKILVTVFSSAARMGLTVAMQPQLRHMVDVIYFNLYRGRFVPDSLLDPSNGCLAKSLLKVGLMPIVAGCRLVVLEQDWAQPALDVDLMSMNVVCGIAYA